MILKRQNYMKNCDFQTSTPKNVFMWSKSRKKSVGTHKSVSKMSNEAGSWVKS